MGPACGPRQPDVAHAHDGSDDGAGALDRDQPADRRVGNVAS